jgi:hypothetical protein
MVMLNQSEFRVRVVPESSNVMLALAKPAFRTLIWSVIWASLDEELVPVLRTCRG